MFGDEAPSLLALLRADTDQYQAWEVRSARPRRAARPRGPPPPQLRARDPGKGRSKG